MFGESLGGEGKEYQVLFFKILKEITKTKLPKNYKKKLKLILVIDFF